MRRSWKWSLIVAAAAVLALGLWIGPPLVRFMRANTVDLDPQLRVVLGGGGNSLMLVSEDRRQVLLVDTKMGRGAERLKREVGALGPEVRVDIVNTHYHRDHTGGNGLFPKARVIAGNYADAFWEKETGLKPPDVKVAAGSDTVLAVGSEIVRVRNLGQGHTLNDVLVYLEHRRLVHTGDLVFDHWHPVMRKAFGSNAGKWVRALDELLGIYDLGTVVPGHGPVTDRTALLRLREYFTSITAALDDPRELAVLRARYAGDLSLPGMSSFDGTVRSITEERREDGRAGVQGK